MKQRCSHDYRNPFQQGSAILRLAAWTASVRKLKLPRLAKGQPAREEAEKVAATSGRPIEEVLESIRLAACIEHVIAVCGDDARSYFLDNACPLQAAKITTLANYAVPRIMAVIPRLRAGSVNVTANPGHAFDTHDFKEVISRLARARGSLTGQAEVWKSGAGIEAPAPVDIRGRLQALKRIQSAAGELVPIIGALPTRALAKNQRNPSCGSTSKLADRARLKAAVNTASGLIAKNLRDLQSVDRPRDLLPSEAQKQRVADEISLILQATKSLTRSLEGLPKP